MPRCSLAATLDVKLVEETMEDRREKNARDEQDSEAAVKGIQAGKELAAEAERLMHRAHAAQKHGGVEESVDPAQILEQAVADHADEQRDHNQHKRDGAAVRQAHDEPGPRDNRLGTVLELRQQRFHRLFTWIFSPDWRRVHQAALIPQAVEAALEAQRLEVGVEALGIVADLLHDIERPLVVDAEHLADVAAGADEALDGGIGVSRLIIDIFTGK